MKFRIYKRDLGMIGIAIIAGLMLGWIFFHQGNEETGHSHEEHTEESETIYTCSMHPQIRQNKPGLCPICAMDLVPVESVSSDEENMDMNEIQMSEASLALASVQTTIVRKRVAEKSISILGKVASDERNISQLTARFGGRIDKLYINFTGQKVNKGEKLATIYSPELLNAQKELLEAKKIKDSNPTFYEAARTKLKLWDLNDSQIEAIIESGEVEAYFDILAPASGTVTKRYVALGDYVKEGSDLFEVVDLSTVWLMFEAYETDLSWIRRGNMIHFSVEALPGKEFSGLVTYIDPVIDPETRITYVRVETGNQGELLKPGMFARGLLNTKMTGEEQSLLIPKSAVLWTGKRSVVYVKIPDREKVTFKYREVILGSETGMEYIVVEGLAEGEEIASNGVFRIDAAAQLAGKQSMMNPSKEKEKIPQAHDHMNMDHGEVMTSEETVHTQFMVYGLCGMCKDRIEKTSFTLNGVTEASWNSETQMLDITYNPDLLQEIDIHKALAAVGHDTKLEKAPDNVYDELPACCKYPRE